MGGEVLASIIAALVTAVTGLALREYRNRKTEALAHRAEELKHEKAAEKARGDLLDDLRSGGKFELRSRNKEIRVLPDETPKD